MSLLRTLICVAYWDGYQWVQPATRSGDQRWLPWVWAGIGGLLLIAAAAAFIGWQHRPVSSYHSSNPAVERFYRELEAHGLGGMDSSDARDWGKGACHGNGLVLWGHDDYSAAQSFEFATIALRACKDI